MKTTKEQRDALRALLEQATPRPWTSYTDGTSWVEAEEDGFRRFPATDCREADAALIAAAVNALPALLDALDAADHALDWEDVEDEWSADVAANHPTRNDGAHQHYATAMRMVGHRHSKGQLVSLVSWLLVRIATLTAERDKLRAEVEALRRWLLVRIATLTAERDKLRAEVEALRRKPMPPTDEEPLDPLSVVRALSSSGYEDELSDEERAACATIAAEVEALRNALVTIQRSGDPGASIMAKRSDGHACSWCRGMWTPCPTETARSALARLDALRKEKA